MKHILIIGPNLGMGGVEKASVLLANVLNESGYKVTYLGLLPKQPFFRLNHTVKYIEPMGFNIKSLSSLKTIFFIRKQVLLQKPDNIIAYTKLFSALSNIALIGTNYKIIFTERSSPFFKWPTSINLLTKLSIRLKKPEAVISQSYFAKKNQLKTYKKVPIHVIQNIVSPPVFYSEVHRENFILCVGRFNDACKGFDQMILAFNLVKNKDWKLYFVGGSEEDAKNWIHLCKPEKKERIVFMGKVENMNLLYAKAGMFVLPSRSEGLPNALIEAFISGVPCISFEFGAAAEIIDHTINGYVVDSGNILSLSEKIDKLIDNKQLRYKFSKEAVKASVKFSKEHLIKQYNQLFDTDRLQKKV